MRSVWRFIDSAPLDGPGNMALDEALLAAFKPDESLPVFRLYGWHPPAFSLGRFQDAGMTLDLDKCRDAGVLVVRRITAGGIIYHAAEITYSIICAPRHISGTRGIKESFRKLCGFLLAAYGELGLEAGFAIDNRTAGERLGERTPLCFAGKEEYDIVIGGRKIGGNAQRRLRDVVFQHGSIPLRNCLAEALPLVRQAARPDALQQGTVSLAELDVAVDEAEFKKMLLSSFANSFQVSMQRSEPDAAEKEAAAWLRENKYARERWNRDGKEPSRMKQYL